MKKLLIAFSLIIPLSLTYYAQGDTESLQYLLPNDTVSVLFFTYRDVYVSYENLLKGKNIFNFLPSNYIDQSEPIILASSKRIGILLIPVNEESRKVIENITNLGTYEESENVLYFEDTEPLKAQPLTEKYILISPRQYEFNKNNLINTNSIFYEKILDTYLMYKSTNISLGIVNLKELTSEIPPLPDALKNYDIIQDINFLNLSVSLSENHLEVYGTVDLVSSGASRNIFLTRSLRNLKSENIPIENSYIFLDVSFNSKFVVDVLDFVLNISQVSKTLYDEFNKTLSGNLIIYIPANVFELQRIANTNFLLIMGTKSESQTKSFISRFLGLTEYKIQTIRGIRVYQLQDDNIGDVYLTLQKESIILTPSKSIIEKVLSGKSKSEFGKEFIVSKPTIGLEISSDRPFEIPNLELKKMIKKAYISLDISEKLKSVDIKVKFYFE